MPIGEQDKVNSNDVVTAFSIVIVEILRALKEQQGIFHIEFITKLHHVAGELPSDPSGQAVRTILTNIAKTLEGKQEFPIRRDAPPSSTRAA